MSNIGDRTDIRNIVSRVSDRLDVYGLGLAVDGGGDILWLISVYKLDVDSCAPEKLQGLVLCACAGGGT